MLVVNSTFPRSLKDKMDTSSTGVPSHSYCIIQNAILSYFRLMKH